VTLSLTKSTTSCRRRILHTHQVRLDSQKHIDFALNSPFGGGRPGRNKRRTDASGGKKKGGDAEAEEAAEDDE
jgi:small subunit ribosomal protein S9e